MTVRAWISGLLFGGVVTVFQLAVVARLTETEAPPPPARADARPVVVDAAPRPPIPTRAPLPPSPRRSIHRSDPAAPRPLIARSALSELPTVPRGLDLGRALPELGAGLGGGDLDLARALEPDRDPIPRQTPSPRYPTEAHRRGLEGFVLLRMRVDESGRVADAVVVDADPRGVFEQSAKRAALAYRFSPARSGGRPVPSTLERRFRFRLR